MRVLAVLLLSALLLPGTTPAAAEPNATDATVAAIAARVEQPELLRGRFEQDKEIAGFSKPLRSQGQFVLARGRGVIWQTEHPFPSRLTVTAKRLRARSGDSVRELDADSEPALRAINALLFDVLAGNVTQLQDRFKVDVAQIDEHGWHLRLLPKAGMFAQVFTAIELDGDRSIERIALDEAIGDHSEIRFSAQARTPALSTEESADLAD